MVGADGHQDLGIGKQGADFPFFLVAQHLADCFFVGHAAVFDVQVGAAGGWEISSSR
jgi:hypothetical protein